MILMLICLLTVMMAVLPPVHRRLVVLLPTREIQTPKTMIMMTQMLTYFAIQTRPQSRRPRAGHKVLPLPRLLLALVVQLPKNQKTMRTLMRMTLMVWVIMMRKKQMLMMEIPQNQPRNPNEMRLKKRGERAKRPKNSARRRGVKRGKNASANGPQLPSLLVPLPAETE